MSDPHSDKIRLRRTLRAARAAVAGDEREADAKALARAVVARPLPQLVCAYVPFGNEPGSTGMLDALTGAGARVWVPVIDDANGPSIRPLRWAEYRGAADLVRGPFGISTPTTPQHPAESLAEAGMVLVPALAVDRAGTRLGRGAGYYDRSLGYADSAARLVAVVRDAELLERIPAEPHDVPMGWALTPLHGMMALGGNKRG